MGKVIIVDHLSKAYRIGRLQHETMLSELIINSFRRGFRRAKGDTQLLALNDISLNIDEGEVVGIVGRNGSGKSTLLKILSRITYPSAGSVRTRGRIASLLEVGTGFHEELSGRENIYLNGSILGMKKREIERHLDAIIDFAGVERFIDTPIKRYSTGMRLRLGFSVAAHLEPDILLVDEVLAVGDAEFQKKCLRTMGDLQGSGRTVLFVSHNMSAIENLCPRTIWIDGGVLRRDGPTSEVLRDYLADYASDDMGRVDLANVEHRDGSGEARFQRLEILGSNEDESIIRSGAGIRLRLHYVANEKIAEPHFGIEIYTNLGTLVTSINTWNVGFKTPKLDPGPGCIEAMIDSLTLMPGHYYVSLWFSSVGKSYDRLDHCAEFDVEASDYFGTGRGMESRMYGVVMMPSQWQHHVVSREQG